MRLVYHTAGEGHLSYRYRNAGLAPVDVWLAHPRAGATQDRVRLVRQSIAPRACYDIGGNEVGYYRVPPLAVLAIDWTFRRLEPALAEGDSDGEQTLTLQERERYLRSSPQIPLCMEIATEARRVAGDACEPLEQAHRFFHALVTGYRYRYPVRRRGALQMQREKSGDCGQFSTLFVAWCRVSGIPARVVNGTFVHVPGMAPHAWAEFWIDRAGWVPVDPSIGQAIASGQHPTLRDPAVVFGRLAPIRFAFSTDVDLPIGDRYGTPVRPLPPDAALQRIFFGGRVLAWGYETLDGTIPYLQPAYPRCYRALGLNALIRPEALGRWAVAPRRARLLALTGLPEQLSPLVIAVLLVLAVLKSVVPPSLASLTGIVMVALIILFLGALLLEHGSAWCQALVRRTSR